MKGIPEPEFTIKILAEFHNPNNLCDDLQQHSLLDDEMSSCHLLP